jgi:hypothetical protein
VQVVYHLREDLRSGCRIAEAVAGSIEGADARFLRDHGLGLVPNDGPAEETCHQNDRRTAGTHAMKVYTPSANID